MKMVFQTASITLALLLACTASRSTALAAQDYQRFIDEFEHSQKRDRQSAGYWDTLLHQILDHTLETRTIRCNLYQRAEIYFADRMADIWDALQNIGAHQEAANRALAASYTTTIESEILIGIREVIERDRDSRGLEYATEYLHRFDRANDIRKYVKILRDIHELLADRTLPDGRERQEVRGQRLQALCTSNPRVAKALTAFAEPTARCARIGYQAGIGWLGGVHAGAGYSICTATNGRRWLALSLSGGTGMTGSEFYFAGIQAPETLVDSSSASGTWTTQKSSRDTSGFAGLGRFRETGSHGESRQAGMEIGFRLPRTGAVTPATLRIGNLKLLPIGTDRGRLVSDLFPDKAPPAPTEPVFKRPYAPLHLKEYDEYCAKQK